MLWSKRIFHCVVSKSKELFKVMTEFARICYHHQHSMMLQLLSLKKFVKCVHYPSSRHCLAISIWFVSFWSLSSLFSCNSFSFLHSNSNHHCAMMMTTVHWRIHFRSISNFLYSSLDIVFVLSLFSWQKQRKRWRKSF